MSDINSTFPSVRFFYILDMITLLEFATTKRLTALIAKERAKCRRKNRGDMTHSLEWECDLGELSRKKQLSRMMPPRRTWVRPSRRSKKNDVTGKNKDAVKALRFTINRDRKEQKRGKSFRYLDELDRYIEHIRSRIVDENLMLEEPLLIPILKKVKKLNGEKGRRYMVTCRPLSVYRSLDDRILLALTSKYLTQHFDRFLHENILSYRPARQFKGMDHHITDFNDGIHMIRDFNERHGGGDEIYVADCDIKKFYDVIPHETVKRCFTELLKNAGLGEKGRQQVMRVLEAYLRSYNFYENTLRYSECHPEVFNKLKKRFAKKKMNADFRVEWVDELCNDERNCRSFGVPQGGSLSLIVANVVLNDVDRCIVEKEDGDRLFIRYCDDMIMMHTDKGECERLMKLYTDSLTSHGLYYHDFKEVDSPKQFWKMKSHRVFRWGDRRDDGERSNRYIGFLGYELRRDGKMRLRRSKMTGFDDKMQRVFFTLRRKRKRLNKGKRRITLEEYKQFRDRMLNRALESINCYSALDMDVFKRGSQYGYMVRRVERLRAKS